MVALESHPAGTAPVGWGRPEGVVNFALSHELSVVTAGGLRFLISSFAPKFPTFRMCSLQNFFLFFWPHPVACGILVP